MEKFRDFTGLVVPFIRENVDTDQIIPKQFLTSVRKPATVFFVQRRTLGNSGYEFFAYR